MNLQPKIVTDRLLIEPLRKEDSHFVYRLVNTNEWKQYIGDRNISSLVDAESYIQRILDNPDIFYWVVKLSDSTQSIGVVTFIKRIYLEYHDIGFAFLPEYSKKGYAYEGVKAVLKHLLPDYIHSNIFATTIPENENSLNLLQKLGMQFKKEVFHEDNKLLVYSIGSDLLRINSLVESFYGVFKNMNGRKPHWDLIRKICIAEVVLICKKERGQDIYNLKSFVEPRKKILSDGTLTAFEEYEISGLTHIHGGIAQRHSRYRKSGILDKHTFVEEGHKFFHFIKTGEGWKITSIIWEDDRS